MKPNTVLATRQGDLGGQKVAMKFDENSIAHIMSVLTDLYSDPELAIIREYSTNAWDAHKEAGHTQPIRIYTPNNLSPFFRVKDSGIGLSVDDIERIYSRYGASTKRGTDEQTGMLGLGCKSALTYTNQFTVISNKDGVQTKVLVSRIEDGTGVMEIVDTRATDEDNGVEIVIPVRYSSTFDAKVFRFFSFWQPGTVLVNDKEPGFICGANSNEVAPNVFMVPGGGTDVVVMGNVAYPVDKDGGLSKGIGGYNRQFHVVAFVKIGSVNFTPSREALHWTGLTTRTINDVRMMFRDAVYKRAQDDIDAAANHAAALATFIKYQDMLGNLPIMNYKGKAISLTYDVNRGLKKEESSPFWRRNYSRNNISYPDYLDYNTLKNVLVITNCDFEKLTATHKAKVNRFFDDNADYHRNMVLFLRGGNLPGSPWTDSVVKVVDYSVIKAVRLRDPNAPKTVKSRMGKFDVLDHATGYLKETDTLDTSKKIYFYSPSDYRWSGRDLELIFGKDNEYVSLGKNRWDKFRREFAGVIEITKALVEEEYKNSVKALTQGELVYLGMDHWQRQHIAKFEKVTFADPELNQYIKDACVTTKSPAIMKYERLASIRREANKFYVYNDNVTVPKPKNPFTKYPLVGNISAYVNVHHVTLYCDAVYNDQNKKEN